MWSSRTETLGSQQAQTHIVPLKTIDSLETHMPIWETEDRKSDQVNSMSVFNKC